MRLPDINDLIQNLQLATQIAIDKRNPNAIVIATMSQAKLLGIDKPIKDVTPNSNINSREPEPVEDYSKLTDDELRQLQAITIKMQKVVDNE